MAIMKKGAEGGGSDPFDDEDDGEDQGEALVAPTAVEEHEKDDIPAEVEVHAEPTQEERASRKERRQNRYREMKDRAERAEAAQAEALQLARAAQFDRISASQPMQQQQHAQQADPEDREIAEAERENDLIYREWSLLTDEQKSDPKVIDEYKGKVRLTERRKFAAVARQEARAQGLRPVGTNDMVQARLRMDYPDVTANTNAMQYAEAYCRQQMALGKKMDWQLMDSGMQEARRAFRLGSQPAPTAAERERYVGVRSSAGGAAEGRRTIKMDRHQKAMARGLYPSDEPAVAYQKWANKVGKELLSQKA